MSQPLCIVIHGFTGNPSEVTSVTGALRRSGYDVVAPLLPGHSYAIEQLPKADAEHWIDAVERIVVQAVAKRRTVHMIGFSMGAMIAAILAHRYALPSLTLLSPAIFVVTPHLLVTRTRGALRLFRDDKVKAREKFRENWNMSRYTPLHNLLQFRRIVRQARQVIPQITCPIRIVYGLQDEIVDPRSAHWIFNHVASKDKDLIHLPQSGHFICADVEQNQVIQIVTQFIKGQKTPTTK